MYKKNILLLTEKNNGDNFFFVVDDVFIGSINSVCICFVLGEPYYLLIDELPLYKFPSNVDSKILNFLKENYSDIYNEIEYYDCNGDMEGMINAILGSQLN